MLIQALLPQPSIESFDMRIVSRLARSGECQLHALLIRPAVQRPGNEFWPIVYLNTLWAATLLPYLTQHSHDIVATQALVHPDRQTFPRESVNQCQCPQLASVIQLIADEVHAPAFIDGSDLGITLPLLRCPAALGAPLVQAQAFHTIQPVDALAVDLPFFPPQQDVDSLVPISYARSCNFSDAYPQWCLIHDSGAIAIQRS